MTKTGTVTSIANLNPYVVNEAETFAWAVGTSTQTCGEASETASNVNRQLSSISTDDWIGLSNVDFATNGAISVSFKVAGIVDNCKINIYTDYSSTDKTGTLIGTVDVPNTGDITKFETVVANLSSTVTGVKNLFFVFDCAENDNAVVIDNWKFSKIETPEPTPTPEPTVSPTPTPTIDQGSAPISTPTPAPIPGVVPSKIQLVKAEVTTKQVSASEKNNLFYSADGQRVRDAIVKTKSGDCYIVDKNGEKYVSAIVETTTGTKYIVDKSGAIVTGKIINTNGDRYYTTKSTGKVVTAQLFKLNGNKYYATKSGSLAAGEIVTVKGNLYYVTRSSGKVVASKMFKLDGDKYIATKSGKLVISKWVNKDGKKYYCNKNGIVIKTKRI
ncbi:MAG: carbohydrate-binding protein [Velocimicrobium sp.]